MKKWIYIIAAAAAIAGCKRPERLEIAQDTIDFTEEGGSVELGITATRNWSATCEGNWLTLMPAGGTPDKKSFTVVCEKNDTYKERSSTIYVRSEALYQEIKVTQSQNDGVMIKGSSYFVTTEEQTLDVLVGSNVKCEVTADVPWLKDVTTKALDYKMKTFSIAANDGQVRKGVISFKKPDGTVEGEITVIQDGEWPVVPPEFELQKGASRQSFTLDVPFEYKVTLDNGKAYWIRSSDSGPNTFDIEENTSGDYRETEILISPVVESSSAKPYSFKVFQLADPSVIVLNHEGGLINAPLFEGAWVIASVNWGDGPAESWYEGMQRELSSAGSVEIEVNGAVDAAVIPSMKNIVSVDLTRF